ncbi:hypothetical protein WA577_003947, partial [Blastocystis sp. JDR]
GESPFLRGVNYRKLLEKYGSLISLLLLTPLVFLLLGFIISNSPNYRPSFIQHYNERTNEWLKQRSLFLSQSFWVNDTQMKKKEESNGPYFPVSDTCNRTNDPPSGCLYSPTSFFLTPISFSSDEFVFTLYSRKNESVFEDHINRVYQVFMTKAELRCSTIPECVEICGQKGGTWNTKAASCNITMFLHRVCYRVKQEAGLISLDTSDLVNPKAVGCFSSSAWSPYIYRPTPPKSTVFLAIRLNVDPVVSSSLFTQGCSDRHLKNATDAACFGTSHEEQLIISNTFFVISVCVLGLEILCVGLVCVVWVGKKRHVSPSRIMSPSYEQIFTPLTYAQFHPVDLPDELAGLGTKGLQERIAVNGTLRVQKPSFADSLPGPVEILN